MVGKIIRMIYEVKSSAIAPQTSSFTILLSPRHAATSERLFGAATRTCRPLCAPHKLSTSPSPDQRPSQNNTSHARPTLVVLIGHQASFPLSGSTAMSITRESPHFPYTHNNSLIVFPATRITRSPIQTCNASTTAARQGCNDKSLTIFLSAGRGPHNHVAQVKHPIPNPVSCHHGPTLHDTQHATA